MTRKASINKLCCRVLRDNSMWRMFAFKLAVVTVQGSVGMFAVYRGLLKVELLISYFQHNVEFAKKNMIKNMMSSVNFETPLLLDHDPPINFFSPHGVNDV